MKRLALAFLVLFATTTLFAGGKECDISKSAAKKDVQMSGTLYRAAAEDGGEKTYFRAADSGAKYVVCHNSKEAALKLAGSKANVKIRGSVVNCGGAEELVIQDAKKI
jgi:hypothetical protein